MLPRHPRIAKILLALLFVAVLLYAYYEARNMLYGPQIELGTTGAITVHDQMVEISGTVRNVVEITLSGNPVYINDAGVFTEKRLLSPGLNRLTFKARDKFDRHTTEVLEVVYEPIDSTKQTSKNTDTIEE